MCTFFSFSVSRNRKVYALTGIDRALAMESRENPDSHSYISEYFQVSEDDTWKFEIPMTIEELENAIKAGTVKDLLKRMYWDGGLPEEDLKNTHYNAIDHFLSELDWENDIIAPMKNPAEYLNDRISFRKRVAEFLNDPEQRKLTIRLRTDQIKYLPPIWDFKIQYRKDEFRKRYWIDAGDHKRLVDFYRYCTDGKKTVLVTFTKGEFTKDDLLVRRVRVVITEVADYTRVKI